MKNKHTIFILIYLICNINSLISQPTNDDCSGAMLLTVSSELFCGNTFINGTTIDATNSGMNDACGGVGDDDVWYKFEVTNTSLWVYIYAYPAGAPISVFYTGSCGNLDSLTCSDLAISGYGITLLDELTVGDTLFLRIFDAGVQPFGINFDVCLYNPPPNDICSGAYEIVPESGNEICEGWISTEGATDQNIGVGECGIDISYDTWYKFTAISNRHIVSFNTAFDVWFNGQFIVEVWDGCSGLELGCMAINYDGGYGEIELNTLVVGNEYFIRLYGSETSEPNFGTLCLRTPFNESEDDCVSAETLFVNGNTCSYSSYGNSLGGATETTTPIDTCSTGPYLDLWYKFEAINNTAIVKTTINSAGNIAISAFSGNSCDTLVQIQCVDDTGDGENELLYLNNLSIGDTIYIRVYDVEVNNTPINFDICVYTPPVNDFCENAAIINTTDGANCLGNIAGNTHGATGSGGCSGGSADDDVWYKFIASDTIHLIHLYNVNISMPIIEIFNNDCSGSQFGCVQGTQFISSDFVIGQQYYLRIYSQANQNGQGSFNICISEPPASIFCENAIGLSVNPNIECANIYTGNSEGQGSSLMKYTFEATSSSQIIYITPISPMTSIGNNLKILDENCSFLDNFGSNSYSGTQRSYYNNFSPGQVYKFEVYNGNPVEGDYQICITEATVNDECINPIVIPSSSINTNCGCDILFSGSCIGATPSNVSPNMGHDVWFSFEATSSTMGFLLNTANGSTNVNGRVYSDCFTSLGIIGSGLTLSNLTIGNEYNIRVAATESDGKPGDFNLCIKTLSNDFCANPIVLTPNAGSICTNPTSGTTIGATPSNVQQCFPSDRNDVWFQFTATASTHLIKVDPSTPGFYPSISVFRKSSGTSNCDMNCIHSSISCSNSSDTIDFMPNIVLLNSLTIGTSYLVAVSDKLVDSPSGDFNICIFSPGTAMNVWSTQVETYAPTSIANVGRYEFPMKRIKLNMTGTTSPSTVTQIVVNTSGTTNTMDLLSAKLYYAGAVNSSSPQGSMPTFKSVKDAGELDPILFAAAVSNPNGQIVFNGSRNIVGQSGEYARYFFLVYDVACNSTIGNEINAELESITISSVNHLPFEALNTSNIIEPQNRYYTKSDGFWHDANTWLCGVPPNGPDILPVTLNHTVTLDDDRQTGNISVNFLKGLSVTTNGVLTLGQSSQGNQSGHSNKTLGAKWGLISVFGTLNVNGNLYVGEYSSNGNNHFGQLVVEGTINIDGNDGTSLGSGNSSITIGTPSVSGSGFINILDPSYNSTGYEFNYNSQYNLNRSVNWTITFGGGDDNSLTNGFDIKVIDQGTGSGFSTLRVKDIFVNGGLLGEKREVNVQSNILPCQNLVIEEGAELIGSVGIRGNFSNNGIYTGGLYPHLEGKIVCADNFGWNSFSTNTVNQTISGNGYFRADATLPYPSSHAENTLHSLLVQTTSDVNLTIPIHVLGKLMIKNGTIITTDTSVLTLGSMNNSGILCQTNSPTFQYSAQEYIGNFELWIGGFVNGPCRRFFNKLTPTIKTIIPVGKNGISRPISLRFSETAPTFVTAEYFDTDPGSTCVPLINEQGLNITNVSPSGYWSIEAENSCNGYEIDFKTSGFLKRGGGAITDFNNLRMVKRLIGQDWTNSCSEDFISPPSLTKVKYISSHEKVCVDSITSAILNINSAYYDKNINWNIIDDDNQIVYSGGPVTCTSNTTNLEFDNKCYTLNINISFSGVPNTCTYYDTLFTLYSGNELLHFGLQSLTTANHQYAFCFNNGNIDTYPTNCKTLKSEFALGGANGAVGTSIVPSNHIVTNILDSGIGSLRYFVNIASCGDTIRFDQSLNGDTITLLSKLLINDKNIFIMAEPEQNVSVKIIIDEPIFDIEAYKTVLLERLKLIASGNFDGYVINNKGYLTLTDLYISTGNTLNSFTQIENNEGGIVWIKGLNILSKN